MARGMWIIRCSEDRLGKRKWLNMLVGHTHIINMYIYYTSQYMGINAKSTNRCYTRLLSQNCMIN